MATVIHSDLIVSTLSMADGNASLSFDPQAFSSTSAASLVSEELSTSGFNPSYDLIQLNFDDC